MFYRIEQCHKEIYITGSSLLVQLPVWAALFVIHHPRIWIAMLNKGIYLPLINWPIGHQWHFKSDGRGRDRVTEFQDILWQEDSEWSATPSQYNVSSTSVPFSNFGTNYLYWLSQSPLDSLSAQKVVLTFADTEGRWVWGAADSTLKIASTCIHIKLKSRWTVMCLNQFPISNRTFSLTMVKLTTFTSGEWCVNITWK